MGEPELLELATLAAEDTGAREGDKTDEASEGFRSDNIFCDRYRYCSINLTLCLVVEPYA